MNRVNAFRHFAEFDGPIQSQQHIKPLHDYVTSRLVLEGGFHPDQLVPHPPLRVIQTHGENRIVFDPSRATVAEATILGGLKTKNVDIVVVKDGIGPVLAVSCKGMTGAIRNLTNRLEETIGECTNIHISYPALVFGYLFVMRANRLGHGVASTDVAIDDQSRPVEAIVRFHYALSAMTDRAGIRNDLSRYEAVAMAMIEMHPQRIGELMETYPPDGSPVNFKRFFQMLYRRYDERYVVSAPQLAKSTRRLEWSLESPVFEAEEYSDLDYDPRLVE